APGGRREVAGDRVEQRGLAGAVGADQRTALTRADRERDVLDRLERAERSGDALEHESVTRCERIRHGRQTLTSRQSITASWARRASRDRPCRNRPCSCRGAG